MSIRKRPTASMETARKVADQLFAAEAAVVAALAEAANLASLMSTVREDARLSAVGSHRAIERSLDALGALGQARAHLINTHRQLSVVQRQVGLDAVDFGGWGDKELPATGSLKLVAGADSAVA